MPPSSLSFYPVLVLNGETSDTLCVAEFQTWPARYYTEYTVLCWLESDIPVSPHSSIYQGLLFLIPFVFELLFWLQSQTPDDRGCRWNRYVDILHRYSAGTASKSTSFTLVQTTTQILCWLQMQVHRPCYTKWNNGTAIVIIPWLILHYVTQSGAQRSQTGNTTSPNYLIKRNGPNRTSMMNGCWTKK